MRWEARVLCGTFVGWFLNEVHMIGVPREPLTPTAVTGSGLVLLGLIWLVVRLGTK